MPTMARTFINLGLEQPASQDNPLAGRAPQTPGVIVEGEPADVIDQLGGGDGLVRFESVNHNGSTKPVWINPSYVRLVAAAA
jgi:hypothetical protein